MIKNNFYRWSFINEKLVKIYSLLIPLVLLISNVSSNKVPEKLVQEGEIVHIPCKVLSELNSIQWFKDGKPVLLDFSHSQRRHWNLSVEGVAYVSIKSASMQDAGEWECWHYNNNSPIAKIKVMNLIVSKPPTPPVLLLNGKSISSTDNLPEYALNIVEKSLSNVNNLKNISNSAVISTSSSRLTLREKYLLTVDCVQLAWTAPKHPSHWFVAGVNMTENAQLFMEYLTDQQVYKVRSSLTFNVTKEMHRGHLVCESENSNWPNSQSMATIELDVQYEPSFSISRTPEFGYHVIPGMTLTLTCDLDANPPAQAKWIRDGDKNVANQSLASDNILDTSALNNAQLVFKEITDANAGWYKCIADHAFGHFESYGYYLAVRSADGNSAQSNTRHTSLSNFGNQSQDQELNRSQKQRNSQTKNNNLYNYYHDQQPITNNLNKSLNQKNSQFLTNDINAAQLNSNHVGSNVANYINSSNVQNKNKCDTPGKPMVVALNRTVFAEVGQQVVVYAVFCCEPKPRKVLWIHRHFSFKPATTFSSYTASKLFMASNSRNCYRSTFKIDNVKKEDSGELFFLVSNLKGLDDAFIHLTVTGKASHHLISCLSIMISFIIIFCHNNNLL